MNPDVEKLLEFAAEAPSEMRANILARESPNLIVQAEVADLLQYADEAGSFFDQAIQAVASSLVTRPGLLPGDLIGSYRVVRMIGKGGMGSVYLAERADGEIDQTVAIKLLRADAVGAGWRGRFLRERRLLASLHHPSVVHVIVSVSWTA